MKCKCKICKRKVNKKEIRGYDSFRVCDDCFSRLKGTSPNIDWWAVHEIINRIGFLRSMYKK